MNKMRTFILICALAAGTVSAGAAQSSDASKAESGTRLTPDEIFALYQGRSWLWNAGAGYFSPRAQRFAAWTDEKGKPSYASGRWFVTGRGKMCFRAEWRAEDGAASDLTCFSHSKRDGVIYQKREPNGDWYVLKRTPSRVGDEYRKIRRGDYVASRYKNIERRLSRDR